jgi:hypothetical protein
MFAGKRPIKMMTNKYRLLFKKIVERHFFEKEHPV